ncbi:MAG: IS91 family transposase, partial [Oceanicoccus sp.]|nr:IS91 family transposase [Oceanicoccus sp.]
MTFRYTENSGNVRTRTLDGADFLWLLLRHVLPRGFRRS